MTRAIALHRYGGPEIPGDPSNGLSRPVVFRYRRDHASPEAMGGRLFAVIEAGLQRPLAQADEAHAALEVRRTTGAVVLIP